MDEAVSVEAILDLAARLSLTDKVRLIERLAPQIERELLSGRPGPRKSLRGIWKGLGITEEEIAQARREMWSDFPREKKRTTRCDSACSPPPTPSTPAK